MPPLVRRWSSGYSILPVWRAGGGMNETGGRDAHQCGRSSPGRPKTPGHPSSRYEPDHHGGGLSARDQQLPRRWQRRKLRRIADRLPLATVPRPSLDRPVPAHLPLSADGHRPARSLSEPVLHLDLHPRYSMGAKTTSRSRSPRPPRFSAVVDRWRRVVARQRRAPEGRQHPTEAISSDPEGTGARPAAKGREVPLGLRLGRSAGLTP